MRHPLSTIALALGLVAAVAVAWLAGGAVANGVLLGYLLGAALCAFGSAWQSHWLRVDPARALRAQIEGFLAKLGALLAGALAFRLIDGLAGIADWRGFVLAYGAAVALLLPITTYETVARSRRAQRSAP